MLRSPRRSSHFSLAPFATFTGVAFGVALNLVSPPASAQNAPAPAAPALLPGQKPPCVPAAAYAIAYDCELFPLPGLAAPAPAVVPAVPVAVVAVAPAPVAVAVVPAGPPTVVPAAPPAEPSAPVAAVDAPAVPPVVVVTPPVEPPATDTSGGPSHAPAYIAFAVGAGGVGMAVAFGILALSNKSTLSNDCPTSSTCPSSASSTVSSLKTDADLADVGIGVAVAGVAVGTILFLTEHKSASTTGKRHVEPWIGLGSAGLKGSF